MIHNDYTMVTPSLRSPFLRYLLQHFHVERKSMPSLSLKSSVLIDTVPLIPYSEQGVRICSPCHIERPLVLADQLFPQIIERISLSLASVILLTMLLESVLYGITSHGGKKQSWIRKKVRSRSRVTGCASLAVSMC